MALSLAPDAPGQVKEEDLETQDYHPLAGDAEVEEDAEEEPAEPEEEKGSGGVAEKKEGDRSKPFSCLVV